MSAESPWWSRALLRAGLMSTHYDVAYKSDVGRKRLENQDVAEVYAFPGGLLGVVCDGMGGHSGGEVASRMAADTIIQYFRALPRAALEDSANAPFTRLEESILWANKQIWEHGQTHADLNKMGTTCVVVLCLRGQAYVAHVGDSRLYLLRARELMRVTRDHSRNQRLVDEGKIKAEDAEHHPGANVISRVLGQYRLVKVECQPAPIALLPGDQLLLCSDGLVRMVEEYTVLDYLTQSVSPTVICHQLIEAANHAGGKDNTTVQLIACTAKPNRPLIFLILLYLLCMLGVATWGQWQAGAGGSTNPAPPLRSQVQGPNRQRVPPIARREITPGLSPVGQRLSPVGQRLSNPRVPAPLRPLPGLVPPPHRSRRRKRRRYRRRRRRRRRRVRRRTKRRTKKRR